MLLIGSTKISNRLQFAKEGRRAVFHDGSILKVSVKAQDIQLLGNLNATHPKFDFTNFRKCKTNSLNTATLFPGFTASIAPTHTLELRLLVTHVLQLLLVSLSFQLFVSELVESEKYVRVRTTADRL